MNNILSACVFICCMANLTFTLRDSPNEPKVREGCLSLAQVSKELWDNDVNRLATKDITLNYQGQIPTSKQADISSQKLFTNVNENKLSGPTYQTFLSLLDNYVPDKGVSESLTTAEKKENTAFLNAILQTKVMTVLLSYLQCRGLVNNKEDLRSVLTKLWLDFYPRSEASAVNDTSGFEHVMAGEYKSSSEVNGFHNWLSFYLKEKTGQLNYYGYVSKGEPRLIGAVFRWNKRIKPLGSFFLGVSPELDIAIYTLCFLTKPNKRCPVVLDGRKVNIQTLNSAGHISTAYPEVPQTRRESRRAESYRRAA